MTSTVPSAFSGYVSWAREMQTRQRDRSGLTVPQRARRPATPALNSDPSRADK